MFICYTLQHFSVCLRICSLNNAPGKVWNKRYYIPHIISHLALSCFTAKIRTHSSPSKSHVHFHPCARLFLLLNPSYFKIRIFRTAPGQPSRMSSFGSNKCALSGRPALQGGRKRAPSSARSRLHAVRAPCRAP